MLHEGIYVAKEQTHSVFLKIKPEDLNTWMVQILQITS